MIQRNLHDVITYWTETGNDSYGGYTFATPTLIFGRWEDSQQKFVDESGDETVSQAVVHVDRDLVTGDWIALGDLTSASDPTDGDIAAYRVQGFSSVTNLRNSQKNRKAFL